MSVPEKAAQFKLSNLTGKKSETEVPTSAYIHIPFCRRRCYYCDFPVSVLGDRATAGTLSVIERYSEWLCREIEATAASLPTRPLKTIFFGGGTPSLLPIKTLERLLLTLEREFGTEPGAEISIEMDPGTFSVAQVKGYQQAGVNRISLGVQAFQDRLLQRCGRSHCVDEIFTAVERIRQAGITNLSLDLISGLPDQTLAQWQASLTAAIALAPSHLSCYDLIIEPQTAFARQYHPGESPLPSDEITAQMYRLAQQMLTEAGFEHYEVSNYAQPGYQCRHNRTYWENRPYYGFGMGAASYLCRQRFTRPRTRYDYYSWVERLEAAGGNLDCPETSPTDYLLETLMLGLRLADGIDLLALSQAFGKATLEAVGTCLQRYYQQGWVEVLAQDGRPIPIEMVSQSQLPSHGRLRLSDPEGFLFSNTILSALFSQLAREQ